MGIVYKAPITEEQTREQVKTIQNDTALDAIRESIRNEASTRSSSDAALNQDLAATRQVLNQEINDRTNANAEIRADLNTETAARTSADTALNEKIDAEISERNASESRMRDEFNTALDNEKTNRMTADNNLNDALTLAVDTEKSLRETADESIRQQLNAEATTRIAEDTTLANRIADEASTRAAEDTKLSDALEAERKARDDADTALKKELTDALASETALRAAADSVLDTAISAEASSRATEDGKLQAAITSEATARQSSDDALRDDLIKKIDAEKAAREAAVNSLNGSVNTALNKYAQLESPTFTGVPKAPTPATGSDGSQITNKAYVDGQIASVAASLNVFTSPTASKDGTKGLVPAPKKTTKLEILTNQGWRPPDDTTIVISTTPSQSGTLTYNRGNQSPAWINFDNTKLKIDGTTSATDAGTYTARFTPLDLYMWSDTLDQRTKEASWRIEPLKLAKPTLTNTDFDFDQSAHAPTIHNFDDTYMNKTGTASATNQGSYTVTFTLKNTNNTHWSDDSTGAINLGWKISTAKIAKPTAAKTEYDYTGSAVTLGVSGFNDKFMSQTGTGTATNTGNYTATFALKDKSNTQWSDGSTADVKISWKIAQKNLPAEFSSGFEQSGALTYNGSEQTVTIAHYSSAYHVLSSDTKKTDAGTYTAKIAPAGSYTWSDGTTTPKSVTWTIAPKKIAKPSATTTAFGYSGSSVNFFNDYVSGYDSTTMTVSADSTKSASTTGNYAVKFTLKNTTNYHWADDSTGTVTINWSIGTNALSEDLSSGFEQAAALTYTGEAQTVTISHTSATYHVITGNTATDAGTYEATIKPVTGYTWSDGSSTAKKVSWTIDPKKIAKPYADEVSFEYVAGQSYCPEVKNYDPLYMTETGKASKSAVGEYKITYALRNATGKTNLVWDDGTSANVVIAWAIGLKILNKPKAVYSDGVEFVYSGQPKTIVIEGFQSDYMDSSGTLTETDAGSYEITYTLKDTSKTKWSDDTTAPAKVTWVINRKPLTLAQSTFSVDEEYYYNQSEQTVSITGYDENYHELSGTTTATTSGTYSATISPLPNYAWSDGSFATKTVNWQIKKAIWRVDSPVEKRADGRYYFCFELEYSPAGTESVERYLKRTVIKGTPTLAGVPVRFKDVGAHSWCHWGLYTVFWLEDTDEYFSAIDFEVTIVPKKLTLAQSTFSATGTYTYNNAEQTVTIAGYDSNYHILGGDFKATAAGTYTATVTPDSNYAWSDGTTDAKEVTWTINQRVINEPTAAETDFVYDKNEHALDITGYDTAYMTQSGTTKASAAGTYTATFTLKDTKNTRWAVTSGAKFDIEWSIGMTKVALPVAKTTAFTFSEGVLREPVYDYDSTTIAVGGTTSATNASDSAYVITFTLKDPATTVWEDGTSSAKSYRWTIARKPLTATKSTFAQSGTLNYSGSSYNVTTYITNYDSNYHSIGGTIIAANAGTYVAKIQPLTNYCWNGGGYAAKSVVWTINSIQIAKPETTDTLPIAYDAKAHTLAVSNFNSTYMTRTGDYGSKTATGDYAITFTLKNTNNTQWVDGTTEPVTINWSIEKTKVTKPTAKTTTFTYGGSTTTRTLTVTNPDSSYVEQVEGSTAEINAGEYHVTFALKNKTLTEWADGATDDVRIDWVINKAKYGIWCDGLYVIDKTYTGKEQLVTYASYKVGASVGTATFANAPFVVGGTLSATEVGEYTLTVTPDSNHTWYDGTSTTREVIWRIVPQAITKEVSLEKAVLICNGSAQTPTLINYDASKMDLGGDVSKTAKGEYTITVTPNKNYCWSDGSQNAREFDWQLVKNVYAKPALSIKTFTYTGSEIAPFSDLDTAHISGTNITGTDAGTYTATFNLVDTVSSEWADGTTSAVTVEWNIARAPIEPPTIDDTTELTFINTSTKQSPTLVGFDETKMAKSGTRSAINAGTYTLTVKPAANYCWENGSTSAIELEWIINRKPIDDGGRAVSCRESWEYTGDEITVIPDYLNSSGSLVHIMGDSQLFSMSGNKASMVGAYTITVSIISGNHCWSDGSITPKEFKWYIHPKPVVRPYFSSSTNTKKDYTGAAQRVTVIAAAVKSGRADFSNWNSDNADVGVGLGVADSYYFTATNVGEYFVKISLSDTYEYAWKDTWSWDTPQGNHEAYFLYWQIGDSGKTAVTKPYLKGSAVTTFTYTGEEINFLEQFEGYDSSTTSATGVVNTDAGTYTATFSLKDKTATVWEGGGTANISFSWSIAKLNVTKPTASTTSFTYSGSQRTLSVKNYNEKYMTRAGTYQATAVGDYTVTYTLSSTKNLQWADGTNQAISIEWHILARLLAKPELTGNGSYEYSGSEKSVTITGFASGSMTRTGTYAATDAGNYSVTFTLKNTTNTTWADGSTDPITLDWEIARKKLSAELSTFAQAIPYPEYTGSEITPTITGYDARYHELSSTTSATTSSGYYVQIAPKTNYAWSNGTTAAKKIGWTILKKTVPIPTTSVTTFEYNGKHQAPSISDFENYSADDIRFSLATSTTINVDTTGKYSVILILKHTANSKWADGTSTYKKYPYTITPVYVDKPAAAATSFTYNGETQSLEVTSYDSTTMTLTGTVSESDAGTYTATFNLKDAKNYAWTGGGNEAVNISWTIAKLKISPNFVMRAPLTYTGDALKPQIIRGWVNNGAAKTAYQKGYYLVKDGAVAEDFKDFYDVTGTFEATNAGDYAITVAPNKNCEWGNAYGGGTEAKTVTWTIAKATPTITVDKTEVTLTDLNLWDVVLVRSNAQIAWEYYRSEDTDIATVGIHSTWVSGGTGNGFKITGKQNGTTTITVAQNGNKNYNAPPAVVITVTVDRSISTLDWADISQYAKAGTLLKYGEIGDAVPIKLSGTVGTVNLNGNYKAVLIGYNHNADYEGENRAHFTICKDTNGADFVFTDTNYGKQVTGDGRFAYFVASGENYSGIPPSYDATSINVHCQEFFEAFTSELQGVVAACTKYYQPAAGAIKSGSYKVWPLSSTEIGGSGAPISNAKAAQYEYFANGNDINGGKSFWTRDIVRTSEKLYIYSGKQNFGEGVVNYSYGIVPCFCIG